MKFVTINENINYIISRILMIYDNNVPIQFNIFYRYDLNKIKFTVCYKNINYDIDLQIKILLSELETEIVIKKIIKKIDKIYN